MHEKILALREKRAKAWADAKAFLDSKQGEDGMLSAEDAAVYDKMEADIVAMGAEIERMEKAANIEAQLTAPTDEPIRNTPEGGGAPATGRESAAYSAEFLNAVRGLPIAQNVLSTSPEADGGYLVPTVLERQIVQGLEENNVVRRLARVISTESDRKIPMAADTSEAFWTPENESIPETKMTFKQKTMTAHKLATLIRVSIELLQDSAFDLVAYIAGDFARAFGAKEEEAFCVGDGDGKPQGIFLDTGGADIGVTLTGATLDPKNADHLIELVYALKSPYRRNASFLMNDKTVAIIRKMKDANGQYLWQPSVQGGEPDRLLGYRLHTSPFVPEVKADALPIAFGDFSHYRVADRLGRTVQRLNELFARNGQVGFIGTQRVDGKVILSEGIKLLKMGA